MSEDIGKLIKENSINLNLEKLEELKKYSKLILNNISCVDSLSVYDLKNFTKLIYNISKVDDSLKPYYPTIYNLNLKGAEESKNLYNLTNINNYKNLESHFLRHAGTMAFKTYSSLEKKLNWLNLATINIDNSRKVYSKFFEEDIYFAEIIYELSTYLLHLDSKITYSGNLNKILEILPNAIKKFKNESNIKREHYGYEILSKVNFKLLKESNYKNIKLARNSILLNKKLISYYEKTSNLKKLAYLYLFSGNSLNSISSITNNKKYAKKATNSYNLFIKIISENEEIFNSKTLKKDIEIVDRNLNIIKSKFKKN